ncbi:MAG: AAA family ATPase [Clostridia bacterium]|nr:AAA family ATPase [Clostridia bacterium]
MGIPVLIEGETGSGKTYSLRNFKPEEIGIFSVEKGRLPFRGDFKVVKHATYKDIGKIFNEPKLKRYVIDDSQYLLVNELFDRAKEVGYQKYTDMALAFRNLVHAVNHNLPDDVIVYFLHHTETDPNTGKVKAKTVGKMIDQYLTLEGCFDIVLLTAVESGQYYFVTQSDGYSTAKSPAEMFSDIKIPNDLKAVDDAIRSYWNL